MIPKESKASSLSPHIWGYSRSEIQAFRDHIVVPAHAGYSLSEYFVE